ncbi:MAG: cytochrome c peroxidase [Flavobacteriales bacterium]|jgi:cytochrome c peroxidase|nr:cytochrome c peroxidase [Flavobacteriales bacterium]
MLRTIARHLLPIAGTLLLLLVACRRDPGLAAPGAPGPTPFQLQVPPWAEHPVHPLQMPADNPLTVEGVALGRRLFHETALSDDFSMSCATCHRQESAFSDTAKFSVGTDGSLGRRNAMAIVNMAWDQLFFWDGRVGSLEAQALRPVVDHVEMRNTWPVVEARLRAHPEYPALFEGAFGSPGIDSMRVVQAIAQFERTLLSFNSPFDRYQYLGDSTALTEAQRRGMDLFFGEAHCGDCHPAPFFHDFGIRNNGLGPDPLDQGLGEVTGLPPDNWRFKVTTLRNIEVTPPYMHNGRLATLEDVLTFYAIGVQTGMPGLDAHMMPWVGGTIDLDAQDRADIVAFLKALTDQDFLTDPAFGAP